MQFLFVRPRLCPQRYFQTSESGFLQIPPHDGHPCLWLTVPTAKSVADFHRQVVAHAGRTKPAPGRIPRPGACRCDDKSSRQSINFPLDVLTQIGGLSEPRSTAPCAVESAPPLTTYNCMSPVLSGFFQISTLMIRSMIAYTSASPSKTAS